MKKWSLELEITENEDEFFQTLDYANQHKVLQTFIIDMLRVNGFDSRIRLHRYEEDYQDAKWTAAAAVTNEKTSG